MTDESLAVRLECAAALGRIGPDAEAALPNLFGMLIEPDVRARTVVASVIRKIGPAAIDYTVAVIAELDADMRERACELLGQLGCVDDSVVEALLASVPTRPANVDAERAAKKPGDGARS